MLGKTLTPPVLSPDSLSFESSRVKLLSLTKTPHICPKILSSRFSSLTLSFHKWDENIIKVDLAAEDHLSPNQSRLFQVSMPWFTWGAAQTPILAAIQETQLWKSSTSHCVKKTPLCLFSGYCTHNGRGDFWAWTPSGAQNTAGKA